MAKAKQATGTEARPGGVSDDPAPDRVVLLARDLFVHLVAAARGNGRTLGHVASEAFTAAEVFWAEADKRDRGDG